MVRVLRVYHSENCEILTNCPNYPSIMRYLVLLQSTNRRKYLHASSHLDVYTCIHPCLHISTNVYTFLLIHPYMFICLHIYMLMYVYSHIRTFYLDIYIPVFICTIKKLSYYCMILHFTICCQLFNLFFFFFILDSV